MKEKYKKSPNGKVVYIFNGSAAIDITNEIVSAEATDTKEISRTQPVLPFYENQENEPKASSSADREELDGPSNSKNVEEVIDYEILHQKDKFRVKLLNAIFEGPIEDGYSHIGEKIIEKAINNYPKDANTWIQLIFCENINNSYVAVGILRCVGRLEHKKVYPWGDMMVIGGLKSSNNEVRESAIRAIENWEDRNLLKLLTEYEEKVSWLAEYIGQVIHDLNS